MSVTSFDALVHRADDTRSTLPNPHGVPVTLFANRDVPIELEAVEQALAFVDLQGTIDGIAGAERAGAIDPFWGDEVGRLERVVLTPDFHRGGGIPVGTVAEARGFVVPQAVGNDVCCGMRLLVTDITRDELAAHLDAIHRPLRAVFFQGQRELPMSPRQREALLREGLWGLHETRADNAGTGLWRHYDARERMRVARALAALPQTAAALARGALTYSAVRELTRVSTAETEAAWLAAADGMVANQIERLVAGHAPGDRPEDPTQPDLRPRVLRLELPPEVYALWRQARAAVSAERGSEISDADFVETICRGAIAPGSGVAGPAHQIAYQQCADCRRATQNGAGRELDVAAEVFERAACDAKLLGSLDAVAPERATTTVTPRVREQVFARDHHRCTVPGCRSARNLEVHHIIEQVRGGKHELWNVTLLCSGHHAALHGGLLTMTGQAPYEIEFRWTSGPPMPWGLDDEARRAMTVRQLDEIFEQVFRRPGAPASGAAMPGERARPTWDAGGSG